MHFQPIPICHLYMFVRKTIYSLPKDLLISHDTQQCRRQEVTPASSSDEARDRRDVARTRTRSYAARRGINTYAAVRCHR